MRTTNAAPDPTRDRFFFIHIMKTGGATFRQHVYANFAAGEVYPYKPLDADMHTANYDVAYLLGLDDARRQSITAYTGHFPFVTTQLMGVDLVTLTLLRDPVARTISYLKHCKRYHPQHQAMTLEEIYEQEFFFRSFIQNHQAKIFAMTPDDKLESYMDWIDIDERRLSVAEANLARVDVVGVNERYDDFIADVHERFGWVFDEKPNRRVGDEPWPVSASLRKKIADDNAADIAFHEYATALNRRRRPT